MVERPVFVPTSSGSKLVEEVMIAFKWHPGFAESQKQKCVDDLHLSAEARLGVKPFLEISSKSKKEAGRKLSAFFLKYELDGIETSVECVFQGSKVFENGGPYTDLYFLDSRSAKKDPRLRNSGKLLKFCMSGKEFPLSPKTAFYDWVYISGLMPHKEWLKRLEGFAGFTDIEFNPEKSINCQARSVAMFVSLLKRNKLESAMRSFDAFSEIALASSV